MRLVVSWLFPIFLLAVGAILFLPGLGLWDLWDLKEMRVAEAAREMVLTQEYYKIQVGYMPVWDLSPLAIWWQALSMQVFGANEVGAHAPNAVLACLALLSVYTVGQRLHGGEFGFTWALLAFCPMSTLLLFRTGLPEPAQAFFLFISVACIAFAAEQRPRGGAALQAALAGFFLGHAVLADGFLALVFVAVLLLVVWVLNGGRPLLVGSDWVLFLLALSMTTFLWFGYEWAVNGPAFFQGLLAQPLWHIAPSAPHWEPSWLGKIGLVVLGLFPTFWLAAPTLLRYREKDPADFRRWMVVFLVLAIIELVFMPGAALAGAAKAALPAGYLAALFVTQPMRKFAGRMRGLWTGLATVLLITSVLAAIFPVWIASRAPWLTDKLAQYGYAPSLPWSGAEGLPSIVLFLLIVPVYRLGKNNKYAPAALILASGWLAFFITSYPFLGRNVQDLVQGGYPRLFAKTAAAPSYAAAIAFKSCAPLFYGRRPVGLMCNSRPDSCFLQRRMAVPVYKVVPTWVYGTGRHLAGFEEIDHAGPYVLFKKFDTRPGFE